jgi:signal transduction histidine kinase
LQVLGNLLSNALKFTPEGGLITLRAKVHDDRVTFEVSDSGPGINAEHLPHIFDRYWFADRRGTGLGLFIAQSIVRAHGDEIRVQSAPGRGATFRFSLVRSPRRTIARRPVEPSQPSVDGRAASVSERGSPS